MMVGCTIDKTIFRQWLVLHEVCRTGLAWFDEQPGTVKEIFESCRNASRLGWLFDKLGQPSGSSWEDVVTAIGGLDNSDVLFAAHEKRMDFEDRAWSAGYDPKKLPELEWWNMGYSAQYALEG